LTVVFFTDRDLGRAFPSILRASGLTVECHADHFAPEAADEDWLAETARRGWVAVSHDNRIRYKPNELAAVVRHNAGLLVVIGAAPHPDLAKSFVATAPQIMAFLETQTRPFIAKVYRASPSKTSTSSTPAAGNVRLWYPDRTP
jgi:hypothetical protein